MSSLFPFLATRSFRRLRILFYFSQNALHFATSKGNTDIVRTLLASKCSARVRDNRGQLALHRAAAIGSVPILNLLLQEGQSPLNATDIDGLTALHHAISEGHGEAALVLLRAGAETDKRDNEGKLAIELAPDTKVCGITPEASLIFLIFLVLSGSEVHFAGCRARRNRVTLVLRCFKTMENLLNSMRKATITRSYDEC